MAVNISPLTEADIPGAIDTIQQAFADDPYNHWVFDDRAKFDLHRNRLSLGIRCRWGMRNGLIIHVAKDAQTGQILGVAMWLPPRPTTIAAATTSWTELAQSWLLWFQQLGLNLYHGRGGLNVRRYYIWKATQRDVQRALWTDPRGYYFCNIVTVLPLAQGRGIGARLFRTVTDRADRERMPCYLESSRAEPNIRIYERMGFHLAREMECDDQGVVCKVGRKQANLNSSLA
ncbi:MAG: hypothetical protein M1837_002507 [Sclerophora amabilis]|nr:MAG: hypothetical protein M1837_002507 [Sclerophora amabilis]